MAGSFFQRMLGTISMLFLARLLSPSDFGIVAVATLAVFFLETLCNLGAKQYIAMLDEVNDDIINSAWTLSICIKLAVWIVFVISAEPIALYLEKPNIVSTLQVLSLILPISSMTNPGMMVFTRELNYTPQFKAMVISKVISFFVVIAHALIYSSHWALVIGTIINYVIPVIFSYYYSAHKVRITLVRAKEQLSFSKWIVLKGVLGFLRSEIDTVLVSKYFSLDTVGLYGMFKNIAMLPVSLIIKPATEPLLATFSRLNSSGGVMPYQVKASLLVSSAFVMPLVAMMMTNHSGIVLLLLGDKWVENSLIFAALSPILISVTLISVLSQLVIANNKIASLFYFDLFILGASAALLLAFAQDEPLVFAALRSGISVFTLVTFVVFVSRTHIKLSLDVLLTVLIPFVASAFAVLVCYPFQKFSNSFPVFFELVVNCFIFGVTYVLALVILCIPIRRCYEIQLVVSASTSVFNSALKLIDSKPKN